MVYFQYDIIKGIITSFGFREMQITVMKIPVVLILVLFVAVCILISGLCSCYMHFLSPIRYSISTLILWTWL